MRKIALNQITTTESVEGWSIKSYCGPVVAHVVTGAGMVTEFFAGLTDVFGGRSKAIRSRLSEIQREAMADLSGAAADLGANWIVGLRLDVNQISGKGTMMFMVTATGTAVLAESGLPSTAHSSAAVLSSEQVRRELERRRLAAIEDIEPWFQKNEVGKIVEYRIPSLAPVFLRWLRHTDPDVVLDSYEKRLEWTLAYFDALDVEDATACLYANVDLSPSHGSRGETDILVRLDLLDFDRTLAFLVSADPRRRWWGVQTLGAKKSIYRPSDAGAIDRCIAAIEARPVEEAGLLEVKRLMGRKQVWSCLRGHENAADSARCSCGLDRRGFGPRDLTPDRALEGLRTMRALLGDAFGLAAN